MTIHSIYEENVPAEEKVLRTKTTAYAPGPDGSFVFGDATLSPKDFSLLITRMRKIMHGAQGIGLSANQIGLPYRLFVAEPPVKTGKPKFYVVLNPVVTPLTEEHVVLDEGCLSVPGVYGSTPRYQAVALTGFDRHGKPFKTTGRGLLAQVFQHETDHLNGKLFIDTATALHEVSGGHDDADA
jgi:peptide deformylase